MIGRKAYIDLLSGYIMSKQTGDDWWTLLEQWEICTIKYWGGK